MWKRGVERWRKISRNGGKNEWINAEGICGRHEWGLEGYSITSNRLGEELGGRQPGMNQSEPGREALMQASKEKSVGTGKRQACAGT